MKGEIRIYFECLEQAQHYILPNIKEGIIQSKLSNTHIRFVRRPKILRKKDNNSIYAIYSLTTPDFLITLCIEDKEIPIIFGEFSEAVKTEDHELQRSNGGIACALAGCIYLKISGKKKSLKKHGGKKDFDPRSVTKILNEVMSYDGYILGEWPTKANNPFILKRDPNYLSCPPKNEIALVKKTIKLAVKETLNNFSEIIKGEKSVIQSILPELSKLKEYSDYKESLKDVSGLKELVEDWKGRKNKIKGKFPRIYLDDKKLIIKINRFSHAADPDRGILIFASTVIPINKVFTRYNVKKEKGRNKLIDDFIEQASYEGLPKSFLKKLKDNLRSNIINGSADLTSFINKNKKDWINNKVLFSIFLFSDGMIIHYKKDDSVIRLFWNRESIFEIQKNNFIASLSSLFFFRVYGKPLYLELSSDINEDEVTYLVVHEILKPNDFEIVSVSYPGAQGDAAILYEKGKGRKQKRMYIDVIAWLPPAKSNNLALEENKSSFKKKEIEDIVNKLNSFKTEKKFFNALVDTLKRIGYGRKLKKIFIGVAFGVSNIKTVWEPSKVDFMVRITDRKTWQVAFFGEEMKSTFKIIEGNIELPEIYSIKRDNKISNLLEYS